MTDTMHTPISFRFTSLILMYLGKYGFKSLKH